MNPNRNVDQKENSILPVKPKTSKHLFSTSKVTSTELMLEWFRL